MESRSEVCNSSTGVIAVTYKGNRNLLLGCLQLYKTWDPKQCNKKIIGNLQLLQIFNLTFAIKTSIYVAEWQMILDYET